MNTKASISDQTICPRCGGPVSRRSPKGLCRRCIARVTLPQSKEPRLVDSGLHVRCPQCGHAIEVGEGIGLSDIRCDSCGTRFSIVDDTTANRTAGALDRIGQFEVHEKLGAGAFGTVWKARDTRLDRWVAIKIPRQRHLEAAETEKFLREARAAAQLRHPNIVSVFEVGREEDLVYIVGDFVEGVSLAEWLAGGRVSPREAARLCRKIASALAHAHEHGVIHRDIKPGNILMDAQGEPHLTDFGLARREAGEVTVTLDGQLLGTPAYMSPELARGEAHQADARTDVYSLGVVLFQLLTGELPFRGSTRMLVHQVIHDDAPSLRKLNSHVPRDLETISLKCLEKEPARRYATAAALGEELERFLEGQPVRARALGLTGKVWRWCRRNPGLATMAAAMVTLLLTVTAVSVVAAWRIATARKGEQREAYYSNIALASKLIEEGSIDRALETLWKCPEEYRHWEWGHLLYLCHQEAASFQAHPTNVTATFFSPDNRWVVSQDVAGRATVWDWEAEEQVFSFGNTSNRAGWVNFNPNGEQLVAAMGTNGVCVWTTTSWQSVRTLHLPGTEISTLSYNSNGAQLVTGGVDGAVTIWDSATGQCLRTFETTNEKLRRVAISPDGLRVVAVAARAAWVWGLESGRLIRSYPEQRPILAQGDSPAPPRDATEPASAISAVFADDTGKHFATVDQEGDLTWWPEGGAPQQLIRIRGAQPDWVRNVYFSPDGRWMANAGEENTARVWDLATGKERLSILDRVLEVHFSRNGERMVTRGDENWVTTWDLVQGRKLKALRGHSTVARTAFLSLDGLLVASGEGRGIVKIWSAGPGRELARDRAWQHVSTFSPDGRLLANCPAHEGVIIRSVRSGRELLRVHPPNDSFHDAAFSPDGRRLATVGPHKTVKVWDLETGELSQRLRGHRRSIVLGLDYSPNGRWIAAGGLDGVVILWDARTGDTERTIFMDPARAHDLTSRSNRVTWVTFDQDSRRLATGRPDGKTRIWEVPTGRLLATLAAGSEDDTLSLVRFLPDRKRLLTCGKQVRVWDLDSGRVVSEASLEGRSMDVSVSSDGRRAIVAIMPEGGFIAGSNHGSIEVWDIEQAPRRLLNQQGKEGFIWAEFSPDDRTVAASSLDYNVHRWESFPWRREDYTNGQVPGARGEEQSSVVGGQWSALSGQSLPGEWAAEVRRYARSYWRERLELERNGAVDEPIEPRVVEVPVDRALFARRDPQAGSSQVDLTDSYTGELGEIFHGKVESTFDHDDDLSQLPVGLLELGGVRFDVRGVIQLRRAGSLGGPWALAMADDPVQVHGIAIQQDAARFQFLLGTIGKAPDGTAIGRLDLQYADGESRSLDLVYGRDIRDWWYDPAQAAEAETTDRARVVWTGTNPVASWNGRRLRLYLNTRDNPRPGIEVISFDFVSTMSSSAPFLIAVTVEK